MGTMHRGLRNVVRHPLRVVLVVALLGTSLMFAGAMVALNASAQARLDATQRSIGTGITIAPIIPSSFQPSTTGSKPTSFRGLSVSDALVPRIERTPGVVRISQVDARDDSTLKGAVQGLSQASGFPTPPPRVFGMTPGGTLTINGFGGLTPVHITHGRGLTAGDDGTNVAIAGETIARANGWHVGSLFRLHGVSVRLVGTYRTGSPINDDSVILPYHTREHIYHTNSAEYITAFAANSTQVTTVVHRLQRALGSHLDIHPADPDANQISALSGLQSNVRAGLLGAIAAGALVMLFAILLIVRERAREIGVLRALGASVATVVGQFAVEVAALSAAAATLAVMLLVAAGPALASAFGTTSTAAPSPSVGGVVVQTVGGQSTGGGSAATNTLTLSAGLTPESVLALCGLAIVLAIVASAIPAYVVARLKPAHVLRQA